METLLTKLNSILAPFDKIVSVLIKLNSVISKVTRLLAFYEVANNLYLSASNAFAVFNNVVYNVDRNRNSTLISTSELDKIKEVALTNSTLSKNQVTDYSVKYNKTSVLSLSDEEIEDILEKYAKDEILGQL